MQLRTSFRLLTALLSTVLIWGSALADSPYRGEGTVSGISALLAPKARALGHRLETRESIDPAIVNVKVVGQGNLSARFTSRWNRTWPSTITVNGKTYDDTSNPPMLQGAFLHGRRNQGALPVAASIINGELSIAFIGRPHGSSQRARYYEVVLPRAADGRGRFRVKSVPGSALTHRNCGNAHESASHVHSKISKPVAAAVNAQAVYRFFQVNTDTDSAWFARYGSESNNQTWKILNIVSTNYYKPQLGLGIDMGSQHANSTQYGSSKSETLLDLFRLQGKTTLGDTDLLHLFVGKDMDEGVVGLAWVGGTCDTDGYNTGLSQFLDSDSVTASIVAHEMGHNFNAQHTPNSSDRGTVMFPSVSSPNPATQFAQSSINTIVAFANSVSCLESREDNTPPNNGGGGETPPTTPPNNGGGGGTDPGTPSDGGFLSIAQEKIRGKLVAIYGYYEEEESEGVNAKDISNVTVTLLLGGQAVATTTTDEEGYFEFGVINRVKRGKKLSVQAAATVSGGQVLSRRINLKGPK